MRGYHLLFSIVGGKKKENPLSLVILNDMLRQLGQHEVMYHSNRSFNIPPVPGI